MMVGKTKVPKTKRQSNRLTVKEIKGAEGSCKLSDGGNLWLHTDNKGHVGRWVFLYSLRGKKHMMGLGSYATVTLAEAREKALGFRKQLAEGIDPLATRQAKQQTDAGRRITFEECAKAYVNANRASWSPKYCNGWVEPSITRYVLPFMGKLSIKNIDTKIVMRVLNQEVQRHARQSCEGTTLWVTRPTTAHLLRGLMEAIFSWAITMGYYTGLNPARWKDNIKNLVPKRPKKHRVKPMASMPYEEVPAFLKALREKGTSIVPNVVRSHGLVRSQRANCKLRSIKTAMAALEFVVLTGVRVSEALNATWSEINEDTKTWSIPGERMKMGDPHRVPLSSRAVEVLHAMKEVGPLATSQHKLGSNAGFIFQGMVAGRPVCSGTLNNVIKYIRGNEAAHAVNHGFRATITGWAQDRTHYPKEVRDRVLAHGPQGAVDKAYERSELFERRRALMEEWAQYCSLEPSGDVAHLGEFSKARM